MKETIKETVGKKVSYLYSLFLRHTLRYALFVFVYDVFDII